MQDSSQECLGTINLEWNQTQHSTHIDTPRYKEHINDDILSLKMNTILPICDQACTQNLEHT